jgi:Tol biopolymer transport system component
MKIDGSELTRLTYNSYSENHVHISPEKTKLVFTAFTRDLNRDGQVSEADMDSAEIGIMNI